MDNAKALRATAEPFCVLYYFNEANQAAKPHLFHPWKGRCAARSENVRHVRNHTLHEQSNFNL